MDPELASAAQIAGATIVTLMATDAWQRTREGITRLWQRIQPQRAENISAELTASREDVLVATESDDQEMLNELRAQWEGQLRRLFLAHPAAAGELRRLLDELSPADAAGRPAIGQHATASGQARVYQAGRDQHITER
ncbi:hypothetical protein HUT19_16830 [Streptomyces sp. NA02950]|nr:hypothetical protein [Streptomyces sp. NA02950]QKV93217.1 hypothetical protein HUT19_16830 [Streptomyces sp. NA02950]